MDNDPFARILVAVDGSSTANAAIAAAVHIATVQGSAIRFVSVFERAKLIAACSEPYGGIDVGATLDAVEATHAAVIDGALAAAAAGGVRATGTVRDGGDAADEILAEARSWQAGCIVIGTHARHGIARAVLGSCAEATLRGSTCPVLIVPHAASAVWRRVACAVDDSPAARRAFSAALDYALRHDAELHLIGVVPIEDAYAAAYERDGFDPSGSVATIYAHPRALLKRLAEEAAARGARVTQHVLGGSDIAERIVSCAERYACNLIAIGTHGRGGLTRAMLGSVAEGVIRTAPVAVLAFHDAHTEHAVEPAPAAAARSSTS